MKAIYSRKRALVNGSSNSDDPVHYTYDQSGPSSSTSRTTHNLKLMSTDLLKINSSKSKLINNKA